MLVDGGEIAACVIADNEKVDGYITARGYSQLDDVVTNTLGGCLGYIIYKTLIRLKRKK